MKIRERMAQLDDVLGIDLQGFSINRIFLKVQAY